MKTILLKQGTIYSMVDDDAPFIGDVLITAGKIVAVGKTVDVSKVDVDQEFDCTDKVVLPGFIDSHCHIGLFGTAMGERGVDGNEVSRSLTPELRAIDSINPFDPEFVHSVKHGVTTVSTGPGSANPIAGQFVTMKTHGRSLDDRVLQEPSAMKMAFGENPKFAHNGKEPLTRMATAALIRDMLFKAVEYRDAKLKAAEKKETPPPFNLGLEALVPVINGTLQVKAHAHRADDVLTAIRIGKEFDLDLSIEHGSEAHLIPDLLDGIRGVIIGPLLGFPHKLEQLNQSAAAGKILMDHGVPFAIMSDLPATHTDGIILAAGACVREGLPAWRALQAITIDAAKILGVDARIGSLVQGKDADVVVFSANPVEAVNAICELTIVNGELAYDRSKAKDY